MSLEQAILDAVRALPAESTRSSEPRRAASGRIRQEETVQERERPLGGPEYFAIV